MSSSTPSSLHIRAPGKLVLLGEYAVLDGTAAIVAAVDRGVDLRVSAGSMSIEAPGDTRFSAAALHGTGAPPRHYRFSDWNPAPTATKAGFGGSAAATVAGVYAGRYLSGLTVAPLDLFSAAEKAHREVQGGGSGVDIAASSWGGVLRFRRGTADVPGGRPAVESLPVVTPVVVWSGQSAATGPRVAQYLAWDDRNSFISASSALVASFPLQPIRTLREAAGLLRRMSASAGIDWATPALDAIMALAQDFGGAAKPSGAGGGDCAVALFPDTDRETAFIAACFDAGFTVLPVHLAPGAALLTPES